MIQHNYFVKIFKIINQIFSERSSVKKLFILLITLSTFAMSTIFNPIEGSECELGAFRKSVTSSRTSEDFIKVYLEHPIPFIPHVKVGYSNISHNKIGKIADNLNLNMYDLTLYYNILDTGINADVGINLKHIDGNLLNSSTDKNKSEKLKLSVLMVYAKVRFDVPATSLSLEAEGNYVTKNGENIYDAQAGVRYTFNSGFGIETGYKVMHLKFDEVDDLNVENKFSGLYGKLVKAF